MMEAMIIYGALCTITDCARMKIENRLLMAGTAAAVLTTAMRLHQGCEDWCGILLAVLPGILLWVFSRLTEGKIGDADGWLVLNCGLFLGYEKSAAVLCTASLLMAVFAGIGLAAGKFRKNTRLPFAPFLLTATVLIRLLLFIPSW